MSTVRELHNEAAKLAQLALVARHEGKMAQAEDLARQAYERESQAADLVPDNSSSEPTRSILYLSAASLAYQCREFQTAQRLVARGLSGYPPPKIEQDLKDIFEQINFEHHLQVRGVILENRDLQISMRGTSVGSGMVLYDELNGVIEKTISLVHRSVERKLGRDFRKGPGRPREIYRQFTPALSAARAGSFAITLRLGVDTRQTSYLVDAPQIIDEILLGIELVNSSNEERINEIVRDDVVDAKIYRQNFISLVKGMAPDGEKISFLGFTSKSRSVGFTRLRDDIRLMPVDESEVTSIDLKPIEIIGVLDIAKGRGRLHTIEINPKDGDPQPVLVADGLLDLVTSYFLRTVKIRGKLIRDDKGGQRIRLEEIWLVDE